MVFFGFHKCWKLFSWSLTCVIYVMWSIFRGPKSFVFVDLSGFVIKLLFVHRVWLESKKRSKRVFFLTGTGLTGCLNSSLFSWAHAVQSTVKVLFSEKTSVKLWISFRFIKLVYCIDYAAIRQSKLHIFLWSVFVWKFELMCGWSENVEFTKKYYRKERTSTNFAETATSSWETCEINCAIHKNRCMPRCLPFSIQHASYARTSELR